MSNVASLMHTAVTDNRNMLGEIAKIHDRMTDVVKNISDDGLQVQTSMLPDEASSNSLSRMADNVNTMTNSVATMADTEKMHFGSYMDTYKGIIFNDKLSVEDRKDALKTFQLLAKESGISNNKLDAIMRIDSEQLTFDRKDSRVLGKLWEDAQSDDIHDMKVRSTLSQIERHEERLAHFAERENEAQDRQKENKKETMDKVKGMGQGLMAFALSAMGLPPELVGIAGDALSFLSPRKIKNTIGMIGGLVKKAVSPLKGISRTIAKVPGVGRLTRRGRMARALAGPRTPGIVSRATRGVVGAVRAAPGRVVGATRGVATTAARATKGASGLLKGAGGLLKGAGAVAKFAGPIGAAVTAAMSIYDFYKGFTDPKVIAGLKDSEKATLGVKVQAGLSSALSGLTFGLVDPDTIYKGIEKGMDYLFGEEGILRGVKDVLVKVWEFYKNVAGKVFDGIISGIKFVLGPDGMITKVSGMINKVGDMIKSLAGKAIDGIRSGIASLFGEEGILSKAANLLKKIFEYTPIGVVYGLITDFQGTIDKFFGEDGLFSRAKQMLDNVWESVVSLFSGLDVSQYLTGAGEMVKKVWDTITGIVSDAFSSLVDIKDVLLGKAKEMATKVWDAITNLIPSPSEILSGIKNYVAEKGGFLSRFIGIGDTPEVKQVPAQATETVAVAKPLPTVVPTVTTEDPGANPALMQAIQLLVVELKKVLQPQVIPYPSGKPESNRASDIDDVRLTLINSDVFG